MDGSGFPVPLAVLAPLGPVRLEPSAKLTDIRIPVRPAESSIEPYRRGAASQQPQCMVAPRRA